VSLSRRDFARGAALAAATAVLPAVSPAQSPAPAPPTLSPSAVAEVDAKFNEVLRRHGTRLNQTQKDEIRRQLIGQVIGLEKLRTAVLENSDQPATVLHLNLAERR
jgi:hypothetical protein